MTSFSSMDTTDAGMERALEGEDEREIDGIAVETPGDIRRADLSRSTPISGSLGQPNVAMPERIASSLAGAALASYAISKKRDIGGAALALAGGYLIFRGVTGQCVGYSTLRTGTGHGTDSPNALIPHKQGVKVEKSFTIQRDRQELYDFWRNFSNLPRFMRHLESVTVLDDKRSHWVAKGPLGKDVEWDAEIINEIPGEMIAWRSTENADIPNTGSVWFKIEPSGRGTVVKVNLEYQPPAGALGALVAKLFGEEPNQQVRDDLRRFKALMEAGEIPTVEGQPQGNKQGHTVTQGPLRTNP
jgi:uncharacterized membrane protein